MISCVLTLVAAVAAPAVAEAQGIGASALPLEVIQRDTSTADDEALVSTFAEEHLAMLETGDAEELKDAKEKLQEVAATRVASPAFRRLFTRITFARLSALASSDETHRAVVAILIIGDLGTPEAVDALDQYLAAPQETKRFAAGVAYRSAFKSAGFPAAAIADRRRAMIEKIGAMIESEPNPLVLNACVQALSNVASGGGNHGPAIESIALDQLVSSVATRVQLLKNGVDDAARFEPCLKAAQDIRRVLTLQAVQDVAQPQTLRDAGGLCGDLYAYVFRRIRANRLALVGQDGNLATVQEARKLEISATKVADDLLVVCKDGLDIGNVNEPPDRLMPLVDRGAKAGDQQYIRSVMDLIGEGGLLTQTGFGFESKRFLPGG